MKRKLTFIVLMLVCAVTLCSCEASSFGAFLENLGINIGGEGDEDSRKISVTENSYVVYPEKTRLTLSYSDGFSNYFVFKLGQVERVPLAYHDSPQYQDGIADINYSFVDTVVTSEVVTESEQLMKEVTISDEVSSSIEAGFEASVSGGGYGVSAGVKTTVGMRLEAKIGSEIKVTGSEESEIELAKVSEQRKEKSFVIEKDSAVGYYRYAICATCDVYVVLECNTREMTYKYDYITVMVGDQYDAILYSERSTIGANLKEKLDFDPEAISDIDLFGVIKPEEKVVTIDIDEYASKQSGGAVRLSSFEGEGYEYSADTGVLTLHGTDAYREITQFVIRGSYGKIGPDGKVITDVISNLSVCISSTHDIEVKLESTGFCSVYGKSAIYASEDTKNRRVTLISAGQENIVKSTGANGAAVIAMSGNDLTLMGYAPLSVEGENSSGDGAIGITADKLTLDIEGWLTVRGGNGVNGINASSVGEGEHGKPGSDGKHGGDAVCVKTMEIVRCTAITIRGGDGGRGGNGSAGNNSMWGVGPGNARNGGGGGRGGQGGAGLYVETCDEAFKEKLSSLPTNSIRGGDGGVGGNGGAGGGSKNVGRGGNGGNGGNAGCAVTDEYGECYMHGFDGDGGAGGRGGSNSNDRSKDGQDGTTGFAY